MSRAYYNENDPKAAAWLRELIKQGHIAPGDVDERSITEISPHELTGYTQQHFFAGIGGWSLALRLARWPDSRPVRTGSCPCQPFSAAGKGLAEADARHLWPVFRDLITFGEATATFGEQVASAAGRLWLARVRADLEGLGYAVGAADLCAAGVGSPQIRQRLWWVAYPNGGKSRDGGLQRGRKHGQQPQDGRAGGLEHAEGHGRQQRGPGVVRCGDISRVADSISKRGCSGPAGREDAADAGQPGQARRERERERRRLSGWATPTARDHKDGSSVNTVKTNGLLGRQVWGAGQTSESSNAQTGKLGALNPAHSRWLMGYPAAWDSCGATAMQSIRSARLSSSKRPRKA